MNTHWCTSKLNRFLNEIWLSLHKVIVSVCFSISSTLMDMESIASSGRSTPSLMNGHGGVSSSSSTKGSSYPCCWDQCHMLFNTSPDLAEHIRGVHVDGQRGGVSMHAWFMPKHFTKSCLACLKCAFWDVKFLHRSLFARRFSCVFGKAVRCITHRPPVRAGCRDTCCHTVETNHLRSAHKHTHANNSFHFLVSI